jgi:hypothetical protein
MRTTLSVLIVIGMLPSGVAMSCRPDEHTLPHLPWLSGGEVDFQLHAWNLQFEVDTFLKPLHKAEADTSPNASSPLAIQWNIKGVEASINGDEIADSPCCAPLRFHSYVARTADTNTNRDIARITDDTWPLTPHYDGQASGSRRELRNEIVNALWPRTRRYLWRPEFEVECAASFCSGPIEYNY